MNHALDAVFKPSSIAVVGASRQQGTIGWEIVHNLLAYGFQGAVFPVNPRAKWVHSLRCYSSIREIPDPVDLAVITVPKELVLDVVEDCGQKGVKGLIVITAGFKETGKEGLAREQKVVEIVERYGMRMVGPNCMGAINTDPAVRMNATFARVQPLSGKVGFMSQSGALGEVILDYAKELGLGISTFVSVGNKANISGNDLLEYWEEDQKTEIILLYLENFGNPRKFTGIARRISRKMPIIVVKAGRTTPGARAASSHTGSLAGLDVAADALLSQCGVMRVTSIDELFDLAKALSLQPPPSGNRVVILTNAGGPAILTTDACVNLGLTMAELSGETKASLRTFLAPEASVENPVDMIASAGPQEYQKAVEVLLDDPSVDALIAIFVPPIITDPRAVAYEVAEASKKYEKTVLGCFMGTKETLGGLQQTGYPIPLYPFPEASAKALSAMVRYGRWLKRPQGTIPTYSVDREKAQAILMKAVERGGGALEPEEAMEVMAAYGIAVASWKVVFSEKELQDCVGEMGFPVVLKVRSRKILHKSDLGLVIPNIADLDALKEAFASLSQKGRSAGWNLPEEGLFVQEFVKEGTETIVGMATDPGFGPLLMVGLGGIFVEILKDVSFRVHPVTDLDAREMLEELKAGPILKGARGETPVDLEYLAECILRVSQLVSDFHEIGSLDINPLKCSTKEKTRAVDVRILVGKEN
ncbi:MAG: acetate--CoA ligase family protein [Armatimonadetes bacterium]|nr:acetate--CoA ligase family protein [Armatimonadota bacterium]